MRAVLSSDGVGLQLVNEFRLEIDAIKTKLTGVDFSKPEGQLQAVGFQHQIKGINRCLELMLEIANM